MKKLTCLAALLLLVSAAEAAPVNYVLSTVNYVNSFAPAGPVSSCPGCGVATAVDDGAGNITMSGVAWGVSNFQSVYNITFDATTTVGIGTSLTKLGSPAPTCIQSLGTVCDAANVLSGLGQATFLTGIGSDNATDCANDRCRVDVTQTASSLVVAIKRALSESATSFNSQTYTLTFSVVPLPAGIWLMGSALGLLGFVRRRASAA